MGSSIARVELDLSDCPNTGLKRKAIVSEFYISWGLNGDTITPEAQFINIYCNVVTLGLNGEIIQGMTEKKTIEIKQGTDEFNSWFNTFDSGFSEGITSELNLHKVDLED